MSSPSNFNALQAPSHAKKVVALLLGLLILLYVAFCWFADRGLHLVLLGPLFAGFIVGLMFPRHSLQTSLFTIVVLLGLGLIALGAGIVYLLLMLPLLVPVLWLGAFLGCVTMRHLRTKHS